MDNITRSIMYVADAVETGYSSVFTFGVKEILNTSEKQELVQILRDLAASRSSGNIVSGKINLHQRY